MTATRPVRSRIPGAAVPPAAGPRPGQGRALWLGPVVIAGATLGAFWPALWNGFVSWDDLHMFPGNPHYRGLGWDQLRWMWTTYHVYEYMPFTWMTYGADYLLWGLDPAGYHLTNLLLHVGAGLVVYALGWRLLALASTARGAPPPAGLALAAGAGALFFALHPLRAEPVAWVSARGSLLGGLCLLLALLAYVQACAGAAPGRPRWGWFAASLGFSVLALLARSTNVMLPVVLAVLDVYPLRRLPGEPSRWLAAGVRAVWWEKVPFLVLALAVVPLALLARFESGDVVGQEDPVAHVAVALFGLAFYLKQTFLLGSFSPLYERPPQLDPLAWPFLLSGGVVLVITAVVVGLRRRWPAGLAVWLTYGAILLPTSGILPFGLQLAADRYTYVACVGWALLLGAAVLAGWRARQRGGIGRGVWGLGVGLGCTVFVGLGALSWQQVQVWRDSRTLWTHAAAVAPDSAVAHLNLGELLEREADLVPAIAHYAAAVRAWPDDARVHTNMGRALLRARRPAEAVEHLARAAELTPGRSQAHVRLGLALVADGQVAEAAARYRRALQLDPGSASVHVDLARALVRLGALSEAVEHYRAALALQPGFPEAAAELESTLRAAGPAAPAVSR